MQTPASKPPTPPASTSTSKAETREVRKIVFVGKPGTGKTTVIRKLVRKSLENHRRVLIVTPHENEWEDIPLVHPRFVNRIATYKGARRIIIREVQDLYPVCELFKNGLLVFDDCRAYVPDTQDPKIRTMLLSCRQNDVDFCAVGHGFTAVPPLFFTYATHFCVFATTDNVARRKNCVLDFDLLKATVDEVNRRAASDPKLAHYYKIVRNV